MQLPFDQAAGRALDTGVRYFQHELRKLLGWKRRHVFFLRFLEHRPNPAERVREDHSRIDPVGHDLVEALAKPLHRFQAAFGFDRAKDLDHHRCTDFRDWSRFHARKNVQRE
ncbi:hypothetical protein D3C81_1744200 [compost metagenome]